MSAILQEEGEEKSYLVFERFAIGFVAIITGIIVYAVNFMGPLVLGIIEYRTSTSGVYQIIGQDFADSFLLGPFCIIGGLLFLLNKEQAKYFLILTPLTLIYKGLSYGLGQEYMLYQGNVESFFWYYLAMIVGGVLIGMKSLTLFNKADAPTFNKRGRYAFSIVTAVLLLMFFMMWAGEVVQVIQMGDTASGSYSNTPTLFWVIRYLDLGITIPIGFTALYLLLTQPKSSYPVILLFFGFFITLGTAVNAMAWVMFLKGDPELQPSGLVLFGILGLLVWIGFLYLVKDKCYSVIETL